MLTEFFAETILWAIYVGFVFGQSFFGEFRLSNVIFPTATTLYQVNDIDTITVKTSGVSPSVLIVLPKCHTLTIMK